jgi:hypothetical protein
MINGQNFRNADKNYGQMDLQTKYVYVTKFMVKSTFKLSMYMYKIYGQMDL